MRKIIGMCALDAGFLSVLNNEMAQAVGTEGMAGEYLEFIGVLPNHCTLSLLRQL